jgi:hypothetical protein
MIGLMGWFYATFKLPYLFLLKIALLSTTASGVYVISLFSVTFCLWCFLRGFDCFFALGLSSPSFLLLLFPFLLL